jgi:hypothetical protein
MLSIQKSPNDKTGLGYVAPSSDVPQRLCLWNLQSQSLLPLLKIKRRKRSTMMFQAFRSLIPSEYLPFVIVAVSVGMFALSSLS